MNIAIISPHCHGNGQTTTAALIASCMAKQNTKVCLTHVRSKSESLYPYYGLIGDKQTAVNAVQVVKLIETGGMQTSGFANYCRNVAENYDVFSLNTESYGEATDAEMAAVVRYISGATNYDYVFYDVDENNLDKPQVKAVLDTVDCAILIVTQSLTEKNLYRAMKGSMVSHTRKIPVFVVINKYRSLLGTTKEYATEMHLDKTPVHVIHENEYIPYYENIGKLKYLTECINSREGEVMELYADINRIEQEILKIKRASRNRKTEEE